MRKPKQTLLFCYCRARIAVRHTISPIGSTHDWADCFRRPEWNTLALLSFGKQAIKCQSIGSADECPGGCQTHRREGHRLETRGRSRLTRARPQAADFSVQGRWPHSQSSEMAACHL